MRCIRLCKGLLQLGYVTIRAQMRRTIAAPERGGRASSQEGVERLLEKHKQEKNEEKPQTQTADTPRWYATAWHPFPESA